MLVLGIVAIPFTAGALMFMVLELVKGMKPAGSKKKRRRRSRR